MLNVDSFITELRAQNPRMGLMMRKVVNAINQTAQVLGVDSTTHQAAPNPPSTINVKAANGLVHVTLTDPTARGRALNYFIEHDTDPSFMNAHVIHNGASRGAFVTLPAKDDNNNAQKWYFRAYSMQPGSKSRSPFVYFGGSQANATGVSVGGTTQLTPLTSTGSGTASTTGQQGGQGFGNPQFVPSETP